MKALILIMLNMLNMAMLCATPAGAQPAARKADTEQMVPVTRGTQLFINNFAGEVVVRAWPRDEVRVAARHMGRVKINVRQSDNAVRIGSTSTSGTPSVDYEISAPAWMPVRVTGQFNYVEVDGMQADVAAETVRGDIRIKGASGIITLKSIEGEVHVEDAKGRINASSVNERITLVRVAGDVTAETINGEITFTDTKASNAEATTVNGDVRYTGTIADNGLYRFTTHQGDIVLGLPDRFNATVSVRTYQGELRTSYGQPSGEVRSGRRQTFTVGGGTAQIELESFGGEIQVRRASEVPVRDRKQNQEQDPDSDVEPGTTLELDAAGLAPARAGEPPAI
jgi:hypothetical protein